MNGSGRECQNFVTIMSRYVKSSNMSQSDSKQSFSGSKGDNLEIAFSSGMNFYQLILLGNEHTRKKIPIHCYNDLWMKNSNNLYLSIKINSKRAHPKLPYSDYDQE